MRLAEDADFPSASWAYSLAKKNAGMKASVRDPEHDVLDGERPDLEDVHVDQR